MPLPNKDRRELRLKWIRALLSGDYTQAQGRLKEQRSDLSGYNYCCLGVLCDVSNVGTWVRTAYCTADEKNGTLMALPLSLIEALNMDRLLESTLIDRNDNGHSFEQIAEYLIEIWDLQEYVNDDHG